MIGFYHPERGYWEAEDDVPQEYRDAYPEGTTRTPARPSSAHEFDGTEWTLPAMREAERSHAVRLMNEWIEDWMASVTGEVPYTEKASWATKAAAARAYQAGSADPTQRAMIATEADLSGEAEAELAAKIVASADRWQVVVAAVTGLRRVTGRRIEAATTVVELDTILESARARAHALARQLGI